MGSLFIIQFHANWMYTLPQRSIHNKSIQVLRGWIHQDNMVSSYIILYVEVFSINRFLMLKQSLLLLLMVMANSAFHVWWTHLDSNVPYSAAACCVLSNWCDQLINVLKTERIPFTWYVNQLLNLQSGGRFNKRRTSLLLLMSASNGNRNAN